MSRNYPYKIYMTRVEYGTAFFSSKGIDFHYLLCKWVKFLAISFFFLLTSLFEVHGLIILSIMHRSKMIVYSLLVTKKYVFPEWSYSIFKLPPEQFVIFKPVSHCFEQTRRSDVKASFARRPVSRLIKPGDITKNFEKKLFSFTGLFSVFRILSNI